MLSPPTLSGETGFRNRWLDNRMSYNHAGQYSWCRTGLRDQRTNEAFLGCENHAHLRCFKGQTSVRGDLRHVHIWCGHGSVLGASLAGLSCEVPSSGWWCFPSSDVLCAFYQLFCPAHVGFMDLHLPFLWCLYLALPGCGANPLSFPGSHPFRTLSSGLLILFPSRSMSAVEQCWPLLDFPLCWRWKMWASPLLDLRDFFKIINWLAY